MTISMAVDEERSGKRKIKKFNFYEEEDNKSTKGTTEELPEFLEKKIKSA